MFLSHSMNIQRFFKVKISITILISYVKSCILIEISYLCFSVLQPRNLWSFLRNSTQKYPSSLNQLSNIPLILRPTRTMRPTEIMDTIWMDCFLSLGRLSANLDWYMMVLSATQLSFCLFLFFLKEAFYFTLEYMQLFTIF